MHRGLKFDFRNRSTRSKKYEAAEATNEKKTRKTHKSVEKKNERIKKWLHYCANQCSLHCMVLLVKVNAIRFTAHEMYAEWFSLGTRINCANIFELRQCIIIKRQIEYRNAIISDRASHIKCRPQNTTHRINAIPFPPKSWPKYRQMSNMTNAKSVDSIESKMPNQNCVRKVFENVNQCTNQRRSRQREHLQFDCCANENEVLWNQWLQPSSRWIYGDIKTACGACSLLNRQPNKTTQKKLLLFVEMLVSTHRK